MIDVIRGIRLYGRVGGGFGRPATIVTMPLTSTMTAMSTSMATTSIMTPAAFAPHCLTSLIFVSKLSESAPEAKESDSLLPVVWAEKYRLAGAGTQIINICFHALREWQIGCAIPAANFKWSDFGK